MVGPTGRGRAGVLCGAGAKQENTKDATGMMGRQLSHIYFMIPYPQIYYMDGRGLYILQTNCPLPQLPVNKSILSTPTEVKPASRNHLRPCRSHGHTQDKVSYLFASSNGTAICMGCCVYAYRHISLSSRTATGQCAISNNGQWTSSLSS